MPSHSTPPDTPPVTLFTLPGPPTEHQTTCLITCTQPSPSVYLLTFSFPPDNRLTPPFCHALLLALDIIDQRFEKGVLVTTSAIGKFYSNGLDFETVTKMEKERDMGFWNDCLYPLWRRLLTYPMPTIALINGHAFAGGLMTAFMHDYRIMNPHRGFLCLNEVEFGASLKAPMSSIFRQKITSPNIYRSLVLEAKRFKALEALKEGIVDGLGGVDEMIDLVKEWGLVGKGKAGVYGRLKETMWRETVGSLKGEDLENDEREEGEREARRRDERRRVEEWEARSGKIGAKL
ncbi:MAG: hypothetical protein LQ351_002287 [Letrouitia transgressa]|nr:MAG: hypothetical protein LQ351_002287 [Letrouitia transgressa]